MKILIAFLICGAAFAQNTSTATTPPQATESVYNYNGSNQLTSICTAISSISTGTRSNVKVSISAVSKANPAVVTSTGHGFAISARPSVTISGATGTGWTTMNATFIATVIDANTFSLYSAAGVGLDSSGFGTLGGTVIFTTTAPRAGVAEWSLQKFTYDGSGNLIWSGFSAGTSAYAQKCSDAGSSTMQQQ